MNKSKVVPVMKSAKSARCKKGTNQMVYERTEKTIEKKQCAAIAPPPIYAVPSTKIRIATGEELRRMLACPSPCDQSFRLTPLGVLAKMIGVSCKLLIVGGLIYVTYDNGLWTSASQTEELFCKLRKMVKSDKGKEAEEEARKNSLREECNEVEAPVALPPPNSECAKDAAKANKYDVKSKWNNFVSCTFEGVSGLPDNLIEKLMAIHKKFKKSGDGEPKRN